MNSERWSEVDVLLKRALQLSADQREAFLERECGADVTLRTEVRELLAYNHDVTQFMEIPASVSAVLTDQLESDAAEDNLVGQSVGQYTLIKMIAAGGMGAVYLAKRSDDLFDRLVAIKVIRQGPDSSDIIERFRVERQLLAQLDHPNIARLLDAGVTHDGRPALIMEYVDGRPITEHCRENNTPFTVRLDLFRNVCDAVGYAHRHLIVHRDLKPGNILVTKEGTVKLLDFGVAEILSTTNDCKPNDFAFRLLTRDYAAPEQLEGLPVSTATDVYSLGVLLYELLVEKKPYTLRNVTWHGLRNNLKTKKIVPPSAAQIIANSTKESVAIARQIRGDVDEIVLKALQIGPERRYQSVSELAHDVRRFQTGFPVTARRDSTIYRGRKFIRRNPISVAITAVLCVALMLAAFVAAREAHRSRRALQRESRVSRFLVDLFDLADPAVAGGKPVSAKEMLDLGARRIAWDLVDEPLTRADLMQTMGRVYLNLGAYADAESLFDQALAIRKDILGVPSAETAESLHGKAECLFYKGEYDAAEAEFTSLLSTYATLGMSDSQEYAQCLNDVAMLMRRQGNLTRAKELCNTVLAMRTRLLGPTHPDTIESMMHLAIIYRQMHHPDEANTLYERALTLQEEATTLDHPTTALIKKNYAVCLRSQNRLKQAEALLRDALETNVRLYGPNHPRVASCKTSMASLLKKLGRLDDAEAMYRDTLVSQESLLGDQHPDVAMTCNNLAALLSRTDKTDEAKKLYARAAEIWTMAYGVNHANAAVTYHNLANLHYDDKQFNKAAMYYRSALEIRESVRQPREADIANTLYWLGKSRIRSGDHASAVKHLKRCHSIQKKTSPQGDKRLAEIRAVLGESLCQIDRCSDGVKLLNQSIKWFSMHDPESDVLKAATRLLESTPCP